MSREGKKVVQEAAPVLKSAFLRECVRVSLDKLVPLKMLHPRIKEGRKYRQIVASAELVGLVEPPAVTKIPNKPGHYYLVDGHLRVEALKQLGEEEVDCMIATDADTYSYNKRVNQLSAVQDHKMIARAIEFGVPEARIAAALGLSIYAVRKRSRLLNGICDGAAAILKDGDSPMQVFELFRKLHPKRQIQAAELMQEQDDYSVSMARVLVATTEPDLLLPETKKRAEAVTAQSLAQKDSALQTLRARNKADEKRLSIDAMNLEVIKGYVAALLGREPIVQWLAKNQRNCLECLAQIAEVKVPRIKPIVRQRSKERPRAYL